MLYTACGRWLPNGLSDRPGGEKKKFPPKSTAAWQKHQEQEKWFLFGKEYVMDITGIINERVRGLISNTVKNPTGDTLGDEDSEMDQSVMLGYIRGVLDLAEMLINEMKDVGGAEDGDEIQDR